jgi:hypothetical protein
MRIDTGPHVDRVTKYVCVEHSVPLAMSRSVPAFPFLERIAVRGAVDGRIFFVRSGNTTIALFHDTRYNDAYDKKIHGVRNRDVLGQNSFEQQSAEETYHDEKASPARIPGMLVGIHETTIPSVNIE